MFFHPLRHARIRPRVSVLAVLKFMVREGCRSHRGFSSYRSLYPEEQKDLQTKQVKATNEKNPSENKTGPLYRSLISAEVSPEGLTWLSRAETRACCFAGLPAFDFLNIIFGFAQQHHAPRGCGATTGGLQAAGLALPHLSWTCSTPHQHPCTAQTKTRDSPAEPAPATASFGIFTFRAFPSVSGTCPLPPVGPPAVTGFQ